jgi:uncharacterized protein (DUF1015 family)
VPRLNPFVGLRFDRSRVGSLERVTAPPYDVISPGEHARLLASSPYNVIRLDLGRIPGRLENDDERYADSARELRAWREDGIFLPTRSEAYYPYEMRFSLHGRRRRVRGLVGAVELEELGSGIVPHEHTMARPVTDRLRLLRALGANLSSVYSVFEGPDHRLAGWLDEVTAADPDARLVDVDGVEHLVWVADPDPGVDRRFDDVSFLIADGHHRYTTALRYRDERRAEHGPGPWDLVMMFVVDATLEQPPVLPYHRIQVAGQPPSTGARVHDLEEVLESVDDDKLLYGVVTWEAGALVHRVDEVTGHPPVICRLHEQQLAGRDAQLQYTPDAVAAEAAVRSREAVAAYLLPATDARTIRGIVDRGGKLPQKSTFFWPKPRTGLVIRPHDAA